MKRIINNLLGVFGYRIRATHAPLQTFSEGMIRVSKIFNIDVVIDVGVAHDTNDLYNAFKGKRFLLVEANPNFKDHLDKIKKSIDARVEMVFCGESKGKVKFIVPQNNRRASAYTKQTEESESIIISVEPLDKLVCRNDLENGNVLLKIDVEGAELDVLKGAVKTLERSEVVVLEICWGVPFEDGSSEYTEIMNHMKEKGFSLYNIVEGGGIMRHDRLTHADFIFVKNNHLTSQKV